jgi:hypothetical protein
MARSHASPSHSPREKHAERPEKTSDSSRKSHHVRRKSGGPRDEKKKPALTRKTTPQLVKTSSGRRDRDRDRDDDTSRDRDRDGGESFPQFWYALNFLFICFSAADFSGLSYLLLFPFAVLGPGFLFFFWGYSTLQ